MLKLISVMLLYALAFDVSAQAAPVLRVYSPSAYQVYQRDTGGIGTITIAGDVQPDGNYIIEARWGDDAWAVIASNVTRVFSGILPNQTQGQAALEVRVQGQTTVISVAYVGIGDVFVIAGQSNASGQGTAYQRYTHPTLKASMYSNAYLWRDLTDPVDINTSVVDTVSSDTTAAGSYWPLLATLIMADQNVPVAFVPTAKGSSSIFAWLPDGRYKRTTLYGAFLNRALWGGGARAVLWHQGETEAISRTSARLYADALKTLADAVWLDLGVPLIPVKLQSFSAATPAAIWQINEGIQWAVDEHDHILQAVDMTNLVADDTAHLKTTPKLQEAAVRWWGVLDATVYAG